jgi:hypothetical protein
VEEEEVDDVTDIGVTEETTTTTRLETVEVM